MLFIQGRFADDVPMLANTVEPAVAGGEEAVVEGAAALLFLVIARCTK